MDESIVEDIKKALSRIDNRLPTPSQKRQALDCVKKVVENPPAKVAPPKKAIGRPASEIRKIFNESKKVIVGKRGPQSVQIAVDLLDKRIKWIEETLGEAVSYEQIELYFKPELARIKTGKEKEGSSETDPIPKPKPKPKPETKPEPKKKPRGRPITTGKSLQPIEREKMGDEDPKIISAKRKEEEREQMREEDPQPKISWYENLDKTKVKAEKAKKEAKAKPKRDEAQKELKKIAKQAQEQLKKAEKEEKKAKAKAEKEAEKAKVKAEKAKVKAEAEARTKKAQQGKAEAEARTKKAQQAKAEAEAKPKKTKAEQEKAEEKYVEEGDAKSTRPIDDPNDPYMKMSRALALKEKRIKEAEDPEEEAKIIQVAREKGGDELFQLFEKKFKRLRDLGLMSDKDFAEKMRHVKIISNSKAKEIKEEKEEKAKANPKEKKFKSTYTNIIPWDILKPLGISKKLPEEWRKRLVKDENGLVAEIEDVKAKEKGFIRTKFVFTLEKKDGDKKEFEINIEYYFDSKIADIIEDELKYDITDDEEEEEPEKEENKKKKKKGSGLLGSGIKKIYANSIMNTQERPDGLVKKVKKVVVKPTPVVIVDRFKKRDFGTAKGNGESQEMPINVPDVSIVPKLKNKGKVGLAPLQSKPRYEGAGNLRNRGFHTQNTKEFIESRYM
jgi:hypothetical protein